jgi:hypothetical protein
MEVGHGERVMRAGWHAEMGSEVGVVMRVHFSVEGMPLSSLFTDDIAS